MGFFTELSIGGASQIGCMMGSDAENTHWDWALAIKFHQKSLNASLIKQGIYE